MPYMLLIIEPTGQRLTRTEAEGREAYATMLRFGERLKQRGVLLAERVAEVARRARARRRCATAARRCSTAPSPRPRR